MPAASTSPSDLAGLLPSRSIAVRPLSAANGETIGVIVLMLVLLGGLVAWLGPGIASDWRFEGAAAGDVRVREARCRSWLGALQVCNVALVTENGAAASERTQWYVFLGGPRDQAATALRSRTDASQVSTDLGVSTVRRRLITLVLLAGVLASGLSVAAAMLLRGVLVQHEFAGMSGRRLTPVVVEIERNNRLPPRRRLWVYLYDDGGLRARALTEWPHRQQPLFTTSDERFALAIRGAEGGTPMLLDAALTGLDLTEAEKTAFHQAFVTRFGAGARATAQHLP